MAKRFHCWFEQSGTFKNEFKKLGFEAYDYDILNDFNETDYQVDLFQEIEKAYRGGQSIMDNYGPDDMIIAFYPCIRFEKQIALAFRGDLQQLAKWSDDQKLEYVINLHSSLHEMYLHITELVIAAIKKGIKLIIENPYSTDHYLVRYWPLKAKLIDKDRSEMGDYYKKPTQYWFINCEPAYNFIFEPQVIYKRKRITAKVKNGGINDRVERSLISKEYANRFIREYVLEGEGNV